MNVEEVSPYGHYRCKDCGEYFRWINWFFSGSPSSVHRCTAGLEKQIARLTTEVKSLNKTLESS